MDILLKRRLCSMSNRKNSKYDDIDTGIMIIEEDDAELYEIKKVTIEEKQFIRDQESGETNE